MAQVAVGGTSRIEVAMPGGEAALRTALAARAWGLERQGEDLVLRRLPAPAAAAPKSPAVPAAANSAP
jgi:hypothetical protein